MSLDVDFRLVVANAKFPTKNETLFYLYHYNNLGL